MYFWRLLVEIGQFRQRFDVIEDSGHDNFFSYLAVYQLFTTVCHHCSQKSVKNILKIKICKIHLHCAKHGMPLKSSTWHSYTETEGILNVPGLNQDLHYMKRYTLD